MKKIMALMFLMGFVFLLAACGATEEDAQPVALQPTAVDVQESDDTGASVMARHHVTIPAEYVGLSNPIPADDASIDRGGEIYTAQCASCHGNGGMGDGPAAANLDPQPAAIASTSQMIGDDYLYWRISEGGAMMPFNSAMIAWEDILDEDARWDVINYVQALGSNSDVAMPQQGMDGAIFDPAVEAAKQEEILATAVSENLITQEEADMFTAVHTRVDEQMVDRRDDSNGDNMDEALAAILADLVATETITQAEADAFTLVHTLLTEAGLM